MNIINRDTLTVKIKAQRCQLTDEHLVLLAGKREVLTATLQQIYGMIRDQAEREVERFVPRNKDDIQTR